MITRDEVRIVIVAEGKDIPYLIEHQVDYVYNNRLRKADIYPHRNTNWVEDLAHVLGQMLMEFFPDMILEAGPPMGLASDYGITFVKPEFSANAERELDDYRDRQKLSDQRYEPGNSYWININPGDLEYGELKWKDFSENTHEYREGTIGNLNRFNYPKRPLPRTIEELVKLIKKEE